MGTVIGFPRRHARIPSRLARRVKRSDVSPTVLASSVDKTRDHHSDGMLSRFHHLITAQLPAPTSAAIASRESQSSMSDRNDVICESEMTMHESLGHLVPKCKAIMSHDLKSPVGHCVLMTEEAEEIAESEWRDAFRARVREAQGTRTDRAMATLLGVSHDRYRKFVSGGASRKTVMPARYFIKFCLITERDLAWLIDGPEAVEIPRPRPRNQPSRKRA